jgi:hypothetical protein
MSWVLLTCPSSPGTPFYTSTTLVISLFFKGFSHLKPLTCLSSLLGPIPTAWPLPVSLCLAHLSPSLASSWVLWEVCLLNKAYHYITNRLLFLNILIKNLYRYLCYCLSYMCLSYHHIPSSTGLIIIYNIHYVYSHNHYKHSCLLILPVLCASCRHGFVSCYIQRLAQCLTYSQVRSKYSSS